jgi:hypothetical protein
MLQIYAFKISRQMVSGQDFLVKRFNNLGDGGDATVFIEQGYGRIDCWRLWLGLRLLLWDWHLYLFAKSRPLTLMKVARPTLRTFHGFEFV